MEKKLELTNKQKNILFNGRMLDGKFRRGWWDVDVLRKTAGCPDGIPDDAVKVLYANGCLAFYTDANKNIVVNSDNTSDDLDAIVKYIAQINKSDVKSVALGGRVYSRASKNLDLLML